MPRAPCVLSVPRAEKQSEYFSRRSEVLNPKARDICVEGSIYCSYRGKGDKQRQREKALDYFRKALPITEEVGGRYGESDTRHNMAMIYGGQVTLREAAAELRKVVALDRLVQHPDLEADRAVVAQIEKEIAE